MLIVDQLRAGYGSADDVLQGISFEVKQGSVATLIGANGAGKTTAMRAISGMIPIRSGRVLFDGTSIVGQESSRIARLGLAHAPEGRRIFGPLSVEDNLLLGAYRRLPSFFGFKAGAQKTLDRVYELFPRLKERQKQAAVSLSGGEQQMLAIGRALMAEPKLVLLDEPSMGLAPVIAKELFAIIRRLKSEGITLLLVEQFAASALDVADHAYVMERGRIVIQGPSTTLKNEPSVRQAYLGDTSAIPLSSFSS